MDLKLLFFCLFLAALFIPAELKPKKEKKNQHEHRDHEHQGGRDHHDHHDHHDRRDHPERRNQHERHGAQPKRRLRYKDIIEDFFFKIIDPSGDDDEDDELSDWLYDLQALAGQCSPNPCLNNGVCEQKGKGKFKCECPKPFHGKRCEKGRNICRRGLCGRGECVLTSSPPFYQCKCKEPFQPPDCKTVSVCEPNPCRNGGKCIRDNNDFDCQCPQGYRGRFCNVGPNDCYVDKGEFYRGNVTETEDGDECLFWNSHFVLVKGTNPFNTYEDKEGLGLHNFCRNPDGDEKPWCFYRRERRLLWGYCDVTKCPDPSVVPTGIAPPVPHPTTAQPPAPKPEPTADAKPTTQQPVTEKPVPTPEPGPTAAPNQFTTCGNPEPKKPITRIFGGLKVTPGTLPWQVSLQVRAMNTDRPFKHVCGGVLIASCWALTAAHCIIQGMDMQVLAGGLTLATTETTEQALRVEDVIVHENFRETPTAVYNDIALLRLRGNNGACANETQFVKAACLPGAPLPDGIECTISGWGMTEQSRYGSNHLLQANVLLINQQKCSEPAIYGKVLDVSMLCAGHLQGGVDSCQGDSGGPLTCKQNTSHVVYGLVSWGDECGRENKPGVYTRVTQYLDWIKSKTHIRFP
ncbi:hypothetical protein Q5P01_021229 [Channa striata]|uniref:trypsin n=1 Tax=Channa striata TaxID=64152 RepID=A0AA88LTW9_CHASR|nr:hypothetical protein Q5P01_021229 [Channa striata]